MFSIGMQELFIILVIALVVVGPKKLPDLAKGLGKGLKEFRKATDDLKEQLNENDTFQDIQGIKDTIKDTVDTVNPKGMLKVEPLPDQVAAMKPQPVTAGPDSQSPAPDAETETKSEAEPERNEKDFHDAPLMEGEPSGKRYFVDDEPPKPANDQATEKAPEDAKSPSSDKKES